MAAISEETLIRIAKEEAVRLGVTLGPKDSISFLVAPDATEAEARQKISEILQQKKEREP